MWNSIQINKQNIEVNTGKAVLIKCPKNSIYAGYSFWHPAKLVRDGYHSYAKSVSYTEEFTFKLVKYGKGRYNQSQILDQIEIDYEEFEEIFETMDNNIVESKKDSESYLEVEEPNKVEVDVEVKEELKND